MWDFQLIFRKVADVKRERELAERRKNEPQLEATQDHLVRKLFSRFRKGPTDRVSTGSSLQTDASSVKDVEKGDSARASDSENDGSLSQELGNKVVKVFPATKVSTEKDDIGTPPVVVKAAPVAAAAPRPKGKWGALMGSGGGSSTPSTAKTITPSDSIEESRASSESPEPSKLSKIKQAASGNKVFPKQSKPLVASGRQETIEELTETTSVGSPAKDMVGGGGVGLPVGASAATTAALMSSTATAEYQQIISNMMDFKVDVKLEIQRLNQKMNKLEDLLGDIATKLNQQLNGPGMGATSSQSQYSHRLLSPTSPMHSDTGGRDERDTSPASGEEPEGKRSSKSHKSGHHHHKHRDRDKKHHRDRDKTPDTLSPESRLSSSDAAGGRSKDKRGGRSKERPKTAGSGSTSATGPVRTSSSDTAVQQMLEDEIEEQGSTSKTSSAGSKEPLLPPKAVIIPTGQRSREFL